MRPKMQVWNTGSNGDANNDGMLLIVKMVQSMAPMLKGLQEQDAIDDTLRNVMKRPRMRIKSK